MLEMGESLNIVNKVINKLLLGYDNYSYTSNFLKNVFISKKNNSYTSMEDLINHFID